jgi:hypothetical protein
MAWDDEDTDVSSGCARDLVGASPVVSEEGAVIAEAMFGEDPWGVAG